ncbi:MAG: histidine kinase N-terminal 7TM domain-containing protein [Anaerolineae bacterium]|nr:histidine kinase N-terminal 7TM domain-containing protein [Anaerolineae bacterium]
MLNQTFVFLIPYAVLIAISAGVGMIALQRRDIPGAGAFGCVALNQALWTFGYIFELTALTLSGKIFWDDVQFLAGIGRVIVVRDITIRKGAEAELRHYRDNLINMVAARTAELRDAVLEAQQLNNLHCELPTAI